MIELHEDNPVIGSVRAFSSEKVVVQRTDGRTEQIEIKGLDGDGQSISVEMTVRKDGNLMASEKTKPNDSRD